MTAASAVPRRRFQPMYLEHEVPVHGREDSIQREELDIKIGRGWRVFATHAVTDAGGNHSIIYVLVQDVELDDDDGS